MQQDIVQTYYCRSGKKGNSSRASDSAYNSHTCVAWAKLLVISYERLSRTAFPMIDYLAGFAIKLVDHLLHWIRIRIPLAQQYKLTGNELDLLKKKISTLIEWTSLIEGSHKEKRHNDSFVPIYGSMCTHLAHLLTYNLTAIGGPVSGDSKLLPDSHEEEIVEFAGFSIRFGEFFFDIPTWSREVMCVADITNIVLSET